MSLFVNPPQNKQQCIWIDVSPFQKRTCEIRNGSGFAQQVKNCAMRFFTAVAVASIPIVGIKMAGAPRQSPGHLIVPIAVIGGLSALTNSVGQACSLALVFGAGFAGLRDRSFVERATHKNFNQLIGTANKQVVECYKQAVRHTDAAVIAGLSAVKTVQQTALRGVQVITDRTRDLAKSLVSIARKQFKQVPLPQIKQTPPSPPKKPWF